MPVNSSHLIWVDLEMTGLEPDHDTVIEIATIVTDAQLTILAEGPVIAIHQTDERRKQLPGSKIGCRKENRPCVATASAKTDDSWFAICLN